MAEKVHFPPGYYWAGEYEDVEWSEWWCPTDERWVHCPGPCPDGQSHASGRITKSKAKKTVRHVCDVCGETVVRGKTTMLSPWFWCHFNSRLRLHRARVDGSRRA